MQLISIGKTYTGRLISQIFKWSKYLFFPLSEIQPTRRREKPCPFEHFVKIIPSTSLISLEISHKEIKNRIDGVYRVFHKTVSVRIGRT